MSSTEAELVAIRKLLVTQCLMFGELLLALSRSPTAPHTVKDAMSAVTEIDRRADAARTR